MIDRTDTLTSEVLSLMREISKREIMPRWKNLTAGDCREKGPGDWVTVADLAAEDALRQGLAKIFPGLTTVGEEEAAADPSILSRLSGDAWVIDPIDGTNLFRAGDEGFGMLVALVRQGRPAGGWVFDCVTGRVAAAADDIIISPRNMSVRTQTTGLLSWHFAEAAKDCRDESGVMRPPGCPPAIRASCSANAYLDVIVDHAPFNLATHDKPWDHAAGVAILQRLGGCATHLDGETYSVTRRGGGVAAGWNGTELRTARESWLDLATCDAVIAPMTC